MRLSIRTKFLLLVGLLMFTVFGTITIYLIQNSTKSLRKDLLDESKAFASLATQPIGNTFAIYKDSGTIKIDQQVDQFIELNNSITNVTVVDINGKTAYSLSAKDIPQITADEASAFEPIFRNNINGALETIVYPYFEASGAHRLSIVFSVSDDEIKRVVRQDAISLVYFGIAALFATLALTYLLIDRLIIRPVRQVSEQAGVISAGNLEQQIIVHGEDEIASLGQSVNKMAESLKTNIAQLKEVDKVKTEFMMITSHNLRTPLSIIKGYLDNMSLVMNDADKLTTSLNRMGASVQRLEIFAEDILTISRFELGNTDLHTDTIKLDEFIGRIVGEFYSTAQLKDLKFESDIQNGDTELQISAPYIRSAIWNLLDNASKFTKQGGTVSLKAKREADTAVITVSDNGIGISAIELPKLFTKFHRGTSTLVYDFEGTGIGLYSSKMMVEKHGGTVTVSSEEGKGSTFTIILPLSKTDVIG